MQTKVEGLILNKVSFKERDVIARLLLRNGLKISVRFFGARGTRRQGRASVVEVAHMLSLELAFSRGTSQLYCAKEWDLIWAPRNIRYHYTAFSTACFILEILDRVTVACNLHDSVQDGERSFEPLFAVASNALYRLDLAPQEDPGHHLLLFLGKLLLALGVFPARHHCGRCQRELESPLPLALDQEHGRFVCEKCFPKSQLPEGLFHWGRPLWLALGEITQKKYRDVVLPEFIKGDLAQSLPRSLFSYLCHHFQLSPKQFRSLSSLSSSSSSLSSFAICQ